MELPSGVLARHLHHLALLGQSEETIKARRRAVRRMEKRIGVPLLEATAADLYAWREELTVTPAVVMGYVSHARELYAWLQEQGLRGDNPVTGIPVPRTGRRLPRPASEDDVLLALEYAPARIRLWLVLAGWCGLRAKEIALLRRESVLDTRQPPVLIVASGATKGSRERIIPLSAFVLAEMRMHGLPGSGYVFRRMDGRPGPNKPHIVSQLCNRHLHDCQIASTLHQLRHRFGTQLYQSSGHNLRLVQDQLGHATPATTSIYTAWDDADAAAAVEALPAPRRLRAVASERTRP